MLCRQLKGKERFAKNTQLEVKIIENPIKIIFIVIAIEKLLFTTFLL